MLSSVINYSSSFNSLCLGFFHASKVIISSKRKIITITFNSRSLGFFPEATRKKIERLKLEVVDQTLQNRTTTSKLALPEELPSYGGGGWLEYSASWLRNS